MNRKKRSLKKTLASAPIKVISSAFIATSILSAFGGTIWASEAPSAKAVLTTNKTSYAPGDEIIVTVKIQDIQNVDVHGLWAQSAAVLYDGNVFSSEAYTTENGTAREYLPSGYTVGSLLSDSDKYDFFAPTDVIDTEASPSMHEVRLTVMDKAAGTHPIQPQDQTLVTFKLRVKADAPKGSVELAFRESFSLMIGNNNGDPDPEYSYDTNRIVEVPVTIQITDSVSTSPGSGDSGNGGSNNGGSGGGSPSNPASPVITTPTPQQPSTPVVPTTPAVPPTLPSSDVFQSKVVNSQLLASTLSAKVEQVKQQAIPTPAADVRNHWAQNNIQKFSRLGFIEGYEDGTMRPDAKITRAEFAVMIDRVFDVTEGTGTASLNDVDKHWAKDAIRKLAEAGIIKGYGDGSFKPNKTITREEMVAIVMRLVNADQLSKDETKGQFADTANSFSAQSIKQAAEAGIVAGKSKDKFDPKSNTTRAEAITVILNTLNLNPELKTLLDALNS